MSDAVDLTLAELEVLPTPRLLSVLKTVRRATVRARVDSGYADEAELARIKKLEDQYVLVKSVCNTREHIKRGVS